MTFSSIAKFRNRQKKLASALDDSKKMIALCGGTACTAFVTPEVREAFEAEIRKRGLEKRVPLRIVGCPGFCEQGPVAVIKPENIFYRKIEVKDVPRIIEESVLGGQTIEGLLYLDPATKETVVRDEDIPFYASQERRVFALCGVVDPLDLEEYIAHDGYTAAARALGDMAPEDVIDEVRQAGLRGRGGAGFPTAVKWGFCANAPGDEKYLVCNADEGDPGAFMDRSILEGIPHVVIEGMLIAAYAIGAAQGIIYARAEYPLAVSNAQKAIEQARDAGFLGSDILGTGFSFKIELREGAGAFVCGEETALIASLEGKKGMPTPRPPFPANKGYRGKPTNINNVETFANVPLIIRNGKDWYSSVGTATSKGTKVFALAGTVNNTGLVEVPMGATLRQIVFDIGGGIPGGGQFKAAQMGGPSGGCVPAQFLDLPIDYESVKEIGAIMGSGGLIVMDEQTCMVDVARYFLEFVQKESCGKCGPCRIGTRHMLAILQRICDGEGRSGDIEELERLAEVTLSGSLCGLGQTAPNPVLSTIRYFREEYRQHIEERRCPAGVCKALFEYHIDPEKCTGCTLCFKNCPYNAIEGTRKELHVILADRCTKCGNCFEVCRFDAVEKIV
jgi:NADH-quinone oxidoreductase subunit F